MVRHDINGGVNVKDLAHGMRKSLLVQFVCRLSHGSYERAIHICNTGMVCLVCYQTHVQGWIT
jgi:hypothetical protein